MIAVTTPEQSRALDASFVERSGLPSILLMETASRALAEHIRQRYPQQAGRGVVIVCGGGNNGGDGYGCARWLASWGLPVRIWSLAAQSSGDAAAMRQACVQLGLPRSSGIEHAGLVVDAMFGTGLDRAITGVYGEVVQAINEAGCPVVAADLPSGLCASTGGVLGVAVKATSTVTFGTLKPGLLAEPGADLSGEIEVVDLGFGEVGDRLAEVVEPGDLRGRWPQRAPGDHKNRSGHLLVIAGSTQLAGAAVLTCSAALAAGAGLVTLATSGGAVPALRSLPPEVMLLVLGQGDVVAPLSKAALARRTAIAAGPGLGNGVADLSGELGSWLRTLWRESPLPMVFDADALPTVTPSDAGERVITPHPGEAGRLLGCSTAEIQADRFRAARRLAGLGTAVLKGRHSLVAAPGAPIAVTTTGNPILASGGTGDVLTGVVGALLARGVPAPLAGRLAVWVHGRAADLLAQERPQGFTASHVVSALPAAIQELMP